MTTQLEQRSPEWHEARRNRITASMVGAILGLSPYMTRDDAMRSMVRDREGLPSEFTGNVATEWGNANEDMARGEYEMESCHDVTQVGFIVCEDWAGASPDGLIGEEGGVEIKCPYGLRNDPVPVFKTLEEQPHYYAQVQFTLWVTGRKWWHFYQWTPHGSRLSPPVMPDQDWQDDNLPKLRQFYAEFLSEAADDHTAPPRVVIDTPEAARMIREWDEIAEQLERLGERKADLLTSMTEAAGGRNALIAGRKLTLVSKEGAVSYAKVVKEKLHDLDLTKWKGKPSKFWKLT